LVLQIKHFIIYTSFMVTWEDMSPEERDRFIYLILSEEALKSIVLIMQRRHGPDVSTETIMRFAFKVALNRMTPQHLKK
jgi:predicted type IV restriction endonuclease